MFSDEDIQEGYEADLLPRVNVPVATVAFLDGLSFSYPLSDSAHSVARNRVLREHRRLNHKCVDCGITLSSDKRRCAYHLHKEREFARTRREKKGIVSHHKRRWKKWSVLFPEVTPATAEKIYRAGYLAGSQAARMRRAAAEKRSQAERALTTAASEAQKGPD